MHSKGKLKRGPRLLLRYPHFGGGNRVTVRAVPRREALLTEANQGKGSGGAVGDVETSVTFPLPAQLSSWGTSHRDGLTNTGPGAPHRACPPQHASHQRPVEKHRYELSSLASHTCCGSSGRQGCHGPHSIWPRPALTIPRTAAALQVAGTRYCSRISSSEGCTLRNSVSVRYIISNWLRSVNKSETTRSWRQTFRQKGRVL